MIAPDFSRFSVALMLAGHALAEPLRWPYKANTAARMSVRQVLALSPRASEGYTPSDQSCGDGTTCSEACGTNYQTCASTDGQTHCFDPSVKQTCCPGGSGDACDAGFFCSADAKGATWCCPDSMTLEQCAKAYGLPGDLTSELPVPTSTPPSVTVTPSNDVGLPTSTPGGNPPPTPAQTTATPPAPTAPTSQVLIETSASFGTGTGTGTYADTTTTTSSYTTLTSKVVQTVITSDKPTATATPTASAPATNTPPPATLPNTTATIIIPAPTVRPSASGTLSGGVQPPTSSVPIAGANSCWSRLEARGGAGLVAAAAAAVAVALIA
ncbi:hypothetical protein MN608_03722 [Microdochium nivale]|nr:hypothetical protein MN608_03722 [Microdochium nivale]